MPETPQAKRARIKQEKAVLEAEALQVRLAEASAQLPWRILKLISKAGETGTAFKLKTPDGYFGWELHFLSDNSLIKFSSAGLISQAEVNNLEWQLDRAEVTLNQILEDQIAAKVRQARRAKLLASLSTEDQEILGLTKPKSSRWP